MAENNDNGDNSNENESPAWLSNWLPPGSRKREVATWLVLGLGGIIIFLILSNWGQTQISDKDGKIDIEKVEFHIAFFLAICGVIFLFAAVRYVVKEGKLAALMGFLAVLTFATTAFLVSFENVGEIKHARGLITVVFAIGTISIALILTLSVLFGAWNQKDMLERFTRGKEVLTILVGILGTVVGFYFGSAGDDSVLPLTIQNIKPERGDPIEGGSFGLTFDIQGGQQPYFYSVNFDDEGIESFRDRRTFRKQVKEPIDVSKATSGEVSATITVRDSMGQTDTVRLEKGKWVTTKKVPESDPPKPPENGGDPPKTTE